MIETLLFNVAKDVLAILAIVISGYVVALLRKKLGVENMDKISAELRNKQAIVDTVVLFVQQTYAEADGDRKLDVALETASRWLASKGIATSTEELRSMIESSVKLFKKEFAENWAESIEPESLTD